MTDLTIFIHIPKTAGTSIRLALAQQLSIVEAYETEQPEVSDEARVVFGHVHYGMHHQLDRPARYVTMVREPVARVLSLHREHVRAGVADPDIERWLDTAPLQVDNAMTRMICGLRDIHFGEVTDEEYEEAVVNMERDFAAVLVFEELARSIAVLEQLVGVALDVPHENMAPLAPAYPGRVYDRLSALNEWDRRVWEYGRALLERSSLVSGATL